ncbi:MAG: type I restriction endonuclease subunit R, partial [Senegalia sp. (in: firmicutes)]|uniref:type I restriction endonuclease subunit R n=1 Tax=Senegalia sp. (in: firmicutes) TaxID=1924098 RepID=UPI003F9D2F19
HLDLAYFKPPTTLNPDQFELYKKNILSVIEELNYIDEKRIDLVLFLNGLPIITMELKNPFTGQDYKNAISQYKKDRNSKELLFRFKERSIVNFALDTDQVYMATKLAQGKTYFLPFNKGNDGGAGNPEVFGKMKTYYLWEEVLRKDSLLEILEKFIYINKVEDIKVNGDVSLKETVIFPRYHQLNCVREILDHVRKKGTGNKYLVQHSAGSGKTNSITWLTHRLASIHDEQNEVIFNGVIVVTDRTVLDEQLQSSIYQLEHKLGLVAKIDKDSSQLKDELEKGTKIIISTIQKFPYILDELSGTKDKRYAIVIDEAHSSTSGKNMMALKESLSLEEAADLAIKEERQIVDTEDKINNELERFVDDSNISFFAFTATPKGTTLKLFGEKQDDGKYYPFHIYSMRQAIEEGFILDVLKNYMTYKMYYKVGKHIEDDPTFDKAKAAKSIARFVSIHPHNIYQKTEVMIEHFRNSTRKKIGGQAKAMLVTSSRKHAVRYKLAFDKYIKEKGYSNLKTLVAFSGKVKDEYMDEELSESKMNDGLKESNVPKEFDKDESKVLIVADKYQTGFDQPKLHTMYVDKKLSGVRAVQTLSRLNRIYPGKEDTFILDFANDPEDIKEAFLPFYKTTVLDNDIEPNEIYTIYNEIFDKQVINKEDVIKFVDLIYTKKESKNAKALMENYVNNTSNRIDEFSREEKIEIRSLFKKFISLYNLIIQIAPFIDSELHRLSIYLRYLIKKIDIESTGGIDITDKVILEYYRLKEGKEESIYLEDEEDIGVNVKVAGGSKAKEDETDYLSSIINNLNDRFGTDFSDSEKLAVEQIRNSLKSDKTLELKAQANTAENFRHAFEPSFDGKIIDEYAKNQNFYGKVLTDESFKNKLMDLLMLEVYNHFQEQVRS